MRFDTGDLAEHIVRCTDAGLQAGFHAIGDAAVDQVLDAVELAGDRARPRTGRRCATASSTPSSSARRTGWPPSGLIASMQPRFDAEWGGPNGMYAQRLGAERAGQLNRFAELAAAGVPLAFGSDAPVTELGPWAAVRAAVHPSDPAAGIDVRSAFAAHTRGGWLAAGRPDEGVLAAGRPGHLRRLAGRPAGRRAARPRRARAGDADLRATVVRGRRGLRRRGRRLRGAARQLDRRLPGSAILVAMRAPGEPAFRRRWAALVAVAGGLLGVLAFPRFGDLAGGVRAAWRCCPSRSTAADRAPAPGSATSTAPPSWCRC